jgi:hypothetical protein
MIRFALALQRMPDNDGEYHRCSLILAATLAPRLMSLQRGEQNCGGLCESYPNDLLRPGGCHPDSLKKGPRWAPFSGRFELVQRCAFASLPKPKGGEMQALLP